MPHVAFEEPLETTEALEVLLHAADLGNCVVGWPISRRWAHRMCEESVGQARRGAQPLPHMAMASP